MDVGLRRIEVVEVGPQAFEVGLGHDGAVDVALGPVGNVGVGSEVIDVGLRNVGVVDVGARFVLDMTELLILLLDTYEILMLVLESWTCRTTSAKMKIKSLIKLTK